MYYFLYFVLTLTFGAMNISLAQENEPMPVELIYFEAVSSEQAILLRWGTATELNNYGFEALRSKNKVVWDLVGFVFGHGTSFAPRDYTLLDSPITQTNTYYYVLKQIDTDGAFKFSDTISVNHVNSVQDNNDERLSFTLSQNYPNPFNAGTVISWQLPVSSHVTLKVYDMHGSEVAVLVDEVKEAGDHSLKLDMSGFASGIYFYQLKSPTNIISRKFILLK